MKITKTQLEAVAAELSSLMNLDPAISTGRKAKKDQLEKDIIEASQELSPIDQLTTDTALILAELGVTITEKAPEPSKPKPSARYTRMAAVTDALKSARKPLDRAEWTERADRLYTDHGGKSNLNETKWSLNYALQVLTAVDAVTETEAGFQLR